jgi:hypothetical protein
MALQSAHVDVDHRSGFIFTMSPSGNHWEACHQSSGLGDQPFAWAALVADK